MDLPGETYLFNLSLLAITFAAVSVLVMLLRQTMGGKLSNFDIFLIKTFVSWGFVVAGDAILPPLVSLFDPPPALLWATASGLAAVLLAAVVANIIVTRRRVSSEPMSALNVLTLAGHWIVVLLLAVNALVPQVQGVGLFAAALSLSIGLIMWAFVRRIASLLGETPGEDWDPKRG
jgi:hypothetical protein